MITQYKIVNFLVLTVPFYAFNRHEKSLVCVMEIKTRYA